MKNAIFLFLVVLLPLSVFAEKTKVVRLADVAPLVSNKSYAVRATSLKVFQAKVNIEKTRADLLPRLNLWGLIKLIINPASILENLSEVAPFLVPANWYRFEQNKIFYLAEREGFRAFWTNEVHTARSLYLRILFDQKLKKHIEECITELEKAQEIIKTQETFGGAKPGSSREVEIRILGLQEDREALRLLIDQEKSELAFALGFKADTTIELKGITDLDLATLKPIDFNDYELKVLSASPERRQFLHFISVVDYIEKEIEYSFYGLSNISRGVSGGIFDDAIPVSGGPSKEASMKMAKTQRAILIAQKTGVEETLRRQIRSLSAQFNSDLKNYGINFRRAVLAKESIEAMLQRVKLGEAIDTIEFAENVRTRIHAETAKLLVISRVLVNQDRLARLTLSNDYSKRPPVVEPESEPGTNSNRRGKKIGGRL